MQDPALARRFQQVMVSEPTVQDTISILVIHSRTL
jgi:ATP-dependent Clp protease ATP-binding subunit ClpB